MSTDINMLEAQILLKVLFRHLAVRRVIHAGVNKGTQSSQSIGLEEREKKKGKDRRGKHILLFWMIPHFRGNC